MIKVEFLGPIGIDAIELDIKNIYELSEVFKSMSAMEQWIDISAIAINDTVIINRELAVLNDGDVVSVLPPVCGG